MDKIKIKNFDIFDQTLNAMLKLVPSAKFSFSDNGMKIYLKNDVCRVTIISNCAESEKDMDICIKDISQLCNIFKMIRNDNKKSIPEIDMGYDNTFLHVKCKNLKTKIVTVKEEVIANVLSKAVSTQLTPVLEFKTTSEDIKKVLGNSFLFSDVENIRVYLNQQHDMLANCIYAEVTNKTSELSNNIVTKLGDITLGKLEIDLILDFNRLSVFNILKSDNIVIQYMDKPVLVSNMSLTESSFFSNFIIYTSIRKS